MLLQDARSICLANEGFVVLELGYNLPQYGLQPVYTRKSFELEYIENAIHRLLSHPKCADFDTIAVLGHSKGGDLALAASTTFTDIIELSIVNSCHLASPVFVDTTYNSNGQNIRYENNGCNPHQLLSAAYKDENGFLRLKSGQIFLELHSMHFINYFFKIRDSTNAMFRYE